MGWRSQKTPARRLMRWSGFGALALTGSVAAGVVAAPVLVRMLVRALSLMVTGSVWLATSVGSGADAWTIAGTIVRALGLALTTPRAFAVFAVLLLVGAVALFGLKRLLDSEAQESLK